MAKPTRRPAEPGQAPKPAIPGRHILTPYADETCVVFRQNCVPASTEPAHQEEYLQDVSDDYILTQSSGKIEVGA